MAATFNHKAIDQAAANEFLDELGDIGSFLNLPSPNSFHLSDAISKGKSPRPGPPGLPYSALKGPAGSWQRN